jgi:hypothetical protein
MTERTNPAADLGNAVADYLRARPTRRSMPVAQVILRVRTAQTSSEARRPVRREPLPATPPLKRVPTRA